MDTVASLRSNACHTDTLPLVSPEKQRLGARGGNHIATNIAPNISRYNESPLTKNPARRKGGEDAIAAADITQRPLHFHVPMATRLITLLLPNINQYDHRILIDAPA